jgi:hypothetical protein
MADAMKRSYGVPPQAVVAASRSQTSKAKAPAKKSTRSPALMKGRKAAEAMATSTSREANLAWRDRTEGK